MKAFQGHAPRRGQVFRSLVVGSALFLGAPAVLADEPAAAAPPPATAVASQPTQAASQPAAATPAEKATSTTPVTPPSTPALAPLAPLTPPQFQIDLWQSSDTVQREYRYPGLRIAGIVVTGIGLAGAVTGGALLIAGAQQSKPGNCREDECGFTESLLGAFVLIGSAPVTAVGIPMWIVGTVLKKEPATATLLPRSIDVGPGSATLRWSF